MKGILEFDLRSEQHEFECASKAHALCVVIWDLDNHLSKILNEDAEKYDEQYVAAIQHARELLWEICDEQDVRAIVE